MNGSTDRESPDRASDGPRTATTPLKAVVTRYERRPDRCTLSPNDRATRTAWLTADVDTFIGLDSAR